MKLFGIGTDIVKINRLKKSKKRPLLFRKNISDTIGKIYFDRKKTYSEADYRLKCDKLKTDTIVGKILEKYENAIKFILTPNKINSIDIKILITFFLFKKIPVTPNKKINEDNIK